MVWEMLSWGLRCGPAPNRIRETRRLIPFSCVNPMLKKTCGTIIINRAKRNKLVVFLLVTEPDTAGSITHGQVEYLNTDERSGKLWLVSRKVITIKSTAFMSFSPQKGRSLLECMVPITSSCGRFDRLLQPVFLDFYCGKT